MELVPRPNRVEQRVGELGAGRCEADGEGEREGQARQNLGSECDQIRVLSGTRKERKFTSCTDRQASEPTALGWHDLLGTVHISQWLPL